MRHPALLWELSEPRPRPLPDLAEGLLGLYPDVALAPEEVVPQHLLLGRREERLGSRGVGAATNVTGERCERGVKVVSLHPGHLGQQNQRSLGNGDLPTPRHYTEWESKAQTGARAYPEPTCPLAASSPLWSRVVSFHAPSGTTPTATWLRPSSAWVCGGSSRLGRGVGVTVEPWEPP